VAGPFLIWARRRPFRNGGSSPSSELASEAPSLTVKISVLPPFGPPIGTRRVFWFLAFSASAVLAALALRTAWDEPYFGVALLVAIFLGLLQRWMARRKLTRLLHSGDVGSVLERWQGAFEDAPHAETMAPLMQATALAANGWLEEARTTLAKAARGPAWEAAVEHRLFLDTMLLTFEGDVDSALEQAARLSDLPLPDAGQVGQRVHTLRSAIGALARAFAHSSTPGDAELLEQAAESSPLIHWAMRYGAAVVAIDEGRNDRARALIDGAPPWPEESAFRRFHDEISVHAA